MLNAKRTAANLLSGLILTAWLVGHTQGAIVHRYDFSSDVTDLVGTADGSLANVTTNSIYKSHIDGGNGNDIRSIDIPVNRAGVIEADFLLGTYWGEQNPGTFASLIFEAPSRNSRVRGLGPRFRSRP